ncbi:MAG TPA: hypothetical protein VHF07_04665 [Nitrospiraceae bacterium]|nr:hypothetical protein [Nitrospiraceae bacterium]
MSCHGITIMSGVIGLLFAVVFLSDIFTPLGLPLFVFYVVPLALSWRLRRRRVPYWLAGASSLATVSSYFLSPSVGDVPAWLPIINRGIASLSSGSPRRSSGGNRTWLII